MLPRAFEQLCHPGLKRTDSFIDVIRGRYISLLVSMILALVIYHWSGLLYGKKAGMFSFIIFLLCPNFLAHGIFVSSDIFACLFMTCSFYFLWRFCRSGRISMFFFASVAVGMAEISKFSMVHLLILFPLLLTIFYFSGKNDFNKHPISVKRLAGLFFLFAGVNWLIICTGHLFYGMFIPFNNFQFRSTTFQHIQAAVHGIGNWLPMPLPASYIKSLDLVIFLDHTGGGRPGSTIGPMYILGKSSMDGFWYYYFVTFFFKLPLSVLVLITLAVVVFITRRKNGSFIKNEMFLLVPSVYFLIYLDFFYSTQIGIRHIIIILPMLYIFIGFFFQLLTSKPDRYLCYGLLVYQCISVGFYFPHFLPYTNEFIVDKKMAYRKIADTNICYGEGQVFLAKYLGSHPDARYLPQVITAGKVVMEVNEMLDIDIKTVGKYNWIRQLTPSDHIHSQYLIFDISPHLADSLRKVHF
jgi:hypothetical protein